MNKRISKKRRLEREFADLKRQKAGLLERIDTLEEAQKLLGSRVGLLEEQVSKNALATNENLADLRAENKVLQDEVSELKRKKSFFRRK